MAATMTLDYAKSLCSPALLRDLSMAQIAEIREVLYANSATAELNVLVSYTNEWLNKNSVDPRDLEPLRVIYNDNGSQSQIDSWAAKMQSDSERSGFLNRYASGNSDTYINNEASLTSLAQDIALLQYNETHNPANSKAAELDELKAKTAARLNLKEPLLTYADLNAADYLVNSAGLDTAGLTVTADDLTVQVAQLDQESGLPDFDKKGMVDLVNKNALALNRNFNSITWQGMLNFSPELNTLWNNVEVVADNLPGGLPPKTKDDYLESLFQAAQVEVYRENIANDKFTLLPAVEQRRVILTAVKDQVIADIIVARAASGANDKIREKLGIPAPNDNQKIAGSPAQAEYNRQVLAQIKNTLGNEANATALINDLTVYLDDPLVAAEDKKVKINPYMLLANHTDKDVDLEAFTSRLNQKLVDYDKKNQAKKYRHTAVLLAKRLHGKVEEKGRKTFGEKAYALAVNMRRFLNNNPGKAWEMVGNLGIAGGSVALTLGLVSNPAAFAIGTAMVTHYFFKSYLYPTLDQRKRLAATNEEYANANWVKKWKMARAAVKKADKYHNFGRNAAAMSIITGVAGGCFAGPLGARAGVAFMTAGANMWRTWREANQAKIMYKRTGDPKYLDQLNGAHGDKIANSKGLKKLGWKAWNFMTSKKGQQVISTGGFLGAAFGMSMRLANANTVTELASHGQLVNQSGLTADGTHNLSVQQVAAYEYSRTPKSLSSEQINRITGANTTEISENTEVDNSINPQNDSQEHLEQLNQWNEQYMLDFENVLDKDINTIARMLPKFRYLQDKLVHVNDYDSKHLSTPAGDPLREIMEKDMQNQLKLLADDTIFQQLKEYLPRQDQETVDALIKSGNYRGLSQFIESGQFQSKEDYLRNMVNEAYENGFKQIKEGSAEIMKNYQDNSLYVNTKLEEFIHDENTAKIIKGLDENGRNKLVDVLLTKDQEKINAFLAEHKTPLRLDGDGNVLNSVQHSSTNEILYGAGHRSGDAEFMKTYTTRTDASYTRMLDRQAVHSNYNDHFVVNGERRIVTSAEYLKDAQERVAENFIKGKPEGMTVKDYVVHRHMLREYIHVDTERDLNGELSRVGVTREQWSAFLKGEYTAEVSDKIFNSKLGGHAGRVLIDKEVICGDQLNAEQVKIVHRALSLNNHDPKSAFSAGRALYVEAYGVPSYANNNYGLQPHWHYELDCDGKGKWVQHIVGSEKKTINQVKMVKMVNIDDSKIEIDDNLEIVDAEVGKNLTFEPVFTQPENEAGGFVIKRISASYGVTENEFRADAEHPSMITFDPEGEKVFVKAGEAVDLSKLNDGKMPEMVKMKTTSDDFIRMNKSFKLKNQTLYHRFWTGQGYATEKIVSNDIILDKGGSSMPVTPITYSQDEIQNAAKVFGEKYNIVLEQDKVSPLKDGGYAMITDKGLVAALPAGEDKLKLAIIGFDEKQTNLSVEQQKELFDKMQQQIQGGQSGVETQTSKTEGLSNQQGELSGDVSKQIAALEKAGNVKLGEIQVQVNPDNLLERGMRTVTKDGFFNEIRNTNTGEIIRVEGVDINGKQIPQNVLMSDQAPESYKHFHHAMDVLEKKRLGANFKGGYAETSKGENVAVNTSEHRIGQKVNPVIGQALGKGKARA